MYEPYEERKGFKIDLEGLKNRIKEKTKNLRYSKQAMTIIAIVALIFLGSVTGYVTYTSKVTEISSKITILEKQMTACQDNVSSCYSDLEDVNKKLSECKTSNQDCESNLQATNTELKTCTDEKGELSSSLQTLESNVSDWESKYNELDENYKILQSEQQDMECNYAKGICGSAGMNYYYVKDDMTVVCCIKSESDFCVEQPSTEVTIEQINC
jgi:chromosome segregation ATPase